MYFGISEQRGDDNQINAKKLAFRYAIFIHSMKNNDSPGTPLPNTGRGEIPGNDFVVSLGVPGAGIRDEHTTGNTKQIESTFMHELGHTLNLRHGGSDGLNCKPNYLSVMSYLFQFDNVVPSRPLDYSRSTLPTLNETSLDESNGIGASTLPY